MTLRVLTSLTSSIAIFAVGFYSLFDSYSCFLASLKRVYLLFLAVGFIKIEDEKWYYIIIFNQRVLGGNFYHFWEVEKINDI